jgi:hypothetical protein
VFNYIYIKVIWQVQRMKLLSEEKGQLPLVCKTGGQTTTRYDMESSISKTHFRAIHF